ncbi:MAG TPA: type II secretion system protein [Phycisphaerales bacterium]|nr:type II secretion system protein [Phycisphaerales bacterium]HRQ75203.1 type II secretion system protein [Phycisphaerales bacterium]
MCRSHATIYRRGFTLIETIAAIVILAVAIPPMVWAVTEAHAQRVGPVKVSTARWLAAEKLEEVIADRHSPSRGYSYLVSGNYSNEATVSGFTGFSRSVNIVETGPDLTSPGTGYKRVTVTVQFSTRTGAQSFVLATVLTEFSS